MQQSIVKKMIMFLTLLMFLLPTSIVSARENIDTSKTGSITINHNYNNTYIKDANFKVFYVGNVSNDGKLTLVDEFESYNIDLDNIKDQSEYDEIADTLSTHIQAENIIANKEEKTDINGNVSFENLKTGLYLVVVDTSTLDNKYIKTKPFLVCLPSKDKTTDEWIYDVKATTKNNQVSGSYIDLNVEKVWINDENMKDRPTSIDVELYRNNELYETITLDESNKWSHIFKELDAKYTYSVKEKNIPKDYVVSYENYTTFIKIKNTYTELTETLPDIELPQTGTPWRQAQFLSAIGLTLITCGYFVKNKNE